MTTAVVFQPAFLPWLGWFDLLDQADVFVLLDDCQLGFQTWQHRNRIVTENGLHWLTIPLKTAGRFGQQLRDVEVVRDRQFPTKMIKTIKCEYARAPYFHFFGAIENTLSDPLVFLTSITTEIIRKMALMLGIETPIHTSTELSVSGTRCERLANICRTLHADTYLSTIGARDYLDEGHHWFEHDGISVQLHQYEHPEYQQLHSPFTPYASALDLILNVGPEEAMKVIRSGRREAMPL